MNRHTKGSTGARIVIALGFAIVAMSLLRLVLAERMQPELPVLAAVPPFELTDQTGEAFGSADLEGRVWVATFIYSTCPGPCPRVMQKVRELDGRLTNDPRLALVSFSVDPDVDTPEVLAEYGHGHGVDAGRWKLLTGPSEDVFDLVRKGFLLGISRTDEGESPPAADGPIVHSVRLVLVDGDRNVRGYYDTTDAEAMERAGRDVARLLEENS